MKKAILVLVSIVLAYRQVDAQLAITGQQPTCHGICNGTAQVINQGINHYHYFWNTGDTLSSVSNLCAGPYQCVVSDSQYHVFDTLYITLQQPQALSISALTLVNALCYGGNNGFVRFGVTGGTGTRYNFTWSDGYTGTLTDSALFNLSAGNFSITITDANNCSASTGFTINQPPAIAVTPQITNASTCNTCNGLISAGTSGGAGAPFNYHWSTGSTSAGISNLCPGAYNLTVTDSTGCSGITTVNVFANQNPLNVSFSTATNIDCQHPAGFLFASPSGNNGPVHYLWSTGSTAPDIYNIPAGVYSLSVTDSSGCFAIATDTIQNLGIIITTLLKEDFNCEINHGQIIIGIAQGTAPYSVHWSSGSTSDSLSAILPGTYTVTVTDHNNCRATTTYNISQVNNNVSLYTTGVNVSCSNRSNGSAYVVLSGGLLPYTYSWNTLPVQTTDTATGLATGSYTVKVTDSFGCTISGAVIIDSNYNQISTTVAIGNCDSIGAATAMPAIGIPPYTYYWNTQPPQTTSTADSLLIGIYHVSVTDSTGCTRTGNANVQFSCTGYITGTVFYDNNANCRIDNGENGIAGITVLATNSNVTFSGVTNLSGQYTIPVTSTGGYRVITAVNASSAILQYGDGGCGYFEVCPATDSVTFITLNDTFPNHNFGFVGSSGFDLAIQAGWTPVNANHQKEYWILYSNHAFLAPYTDSATITFNYDPNLTFQSGIPAPVNDALNHTLTWIVDSLPSPSYLWADRVRAFFTVATGLPSNYQLKNNFHIEPYSGDCDTSNNSIYTNEIAGLPSVPISKEVYPAGEITMADSVLTYTIHFQNNGPDTVQVIKITDTLSFWLDPQSVVNIASSPLFNQFYTMPGAVLTWVFNPAALPDSSVNPITSSGFVSFKARFKSDVHSGAIIQNKALISFDNATPVITNTTSSYVAFPTDVVEIGDNAVSIKVFPDPFNNIATVSVEGITGPYNFDLIDVTGRHVKHLTDITTTRFELSRNDLAPGVYIYGVYKLNKALVFGKLVIE